MNFKSANIDGHNNMSREESNKFIEEARLLLPWYLTNTLSDDEQVLVNKALEASPELRKEFVREEKMMRLVKENTSLLELSALDTTEQRLENTLARIEWDEQQAAEPVGEASISTMQHSATKTESSSWFSRLFKQKLFDVEWLTPANAVFASLLAINAGVLGYHQLSQPDTVYVDHANAAYTSASVAQQATATAVKSLQQQFLMEFQMDAQHGEVCDFLNEWNARIVEGPNSRNVFIVEMPTTPHTDVAALASDIMAKASNNKAPVVFIGPKFQD